MNLTILTFSITQQLEVVKHYCDFFELRVRIEIFLNNYNPLPQLMNTGQLWKFAFAEVSMFVNDFILKLQGKTVLTCNVISTALAYKESQAASYSSYKEIRLPVPYKFVVDMFSKLKLQLNCIFQTLMQEESKSPCFKIHLVV